jgi:hypothetical protein
MGKVNPTVQKAQGKTFSKFVYVFSVLISIPVPGKISNGIFKLLFDHVPVSSTFLQKYLCHLQPHPRPSQVLTCDLMRFKVFTLFFRERLRHKKNERRKEMRKKRKENKGSRNERAKEARM